MTALLFSIPRSRRPLSVMRDAVVRRLNQVSRRLERIYANAVENDIRDDGRWTACSWLSAAETRLEKLLACLENKLAPHLAARRDALALEAEQRRKHEQLEREIAAEKNRDAINAAIDADPRVAVALADYEAANQWLLVAIDAEEAHEAAMLAAPFPENATLRKKLIPIRGKTTRARNKTSKAYSELAAIRDRVRREQERTTE